MLYYCNIYNFEQKRKLSNIWQTRCSRAVIQTPKSFVKWLFTKYVSGILIGGEIIKGILQFNKHILFTESWCTFSLLENTQIFPNLIFFFFFVCHKYAIKWFYKEFTLQGFSVSILLIIEIVSQPNYNPCKS